MEYINHIVESNAFEIIMKLTLSALLAGLIGIERSSLNKPAGFGTHAIIGLSSALVVMSSEFMAGFYDIDVSRIPSQIIAGIGFIGAGTILRNGFNVRGVTTAAGILSVTCIGISVGMGYYLAAIIATAIVYFVLSVNHGVNERFERFEILDLSIIVDGNHDEIIEEIENFCKDQKINVQSIEKEIYVRKGKSLSEFRISGSYDSRNNKKSKIISKLIAKDNIIKVVDENNVTQ